MGLKKCVLILFVILLFTQLIGIYNFGVSFVRSGGVPMESVIVGESKDCMFFKQIWQFRLKNCSEYQSASVVSFVGRLVTSTDSEFSNRKRLNVTEISQNNNLLYSVIAWTVVVNKWLGGHRDTLIYSVMGYMGQSQYSLMTDMVFGQILDMGEQQHHNLKITGMLHVVAASGFNISLITIIANFFSRHFGRFKSFLIWVALVGGYFLLTDLSVSIVRAFLMMFIKKSGVLLGYRNYHNLYSLATASFVILLFDPLIMFSISFQLSVLATLGIILFMPLFGIINPAIENEALSSLWPIIKESFQTTLAAQVLTVPIILFHFSELSLLSFFSNTALLWLTPLITLGGVLYYFLSFLFLFLPLEPLIQILSFFLYLPATFFLRAIELFSQVEFLFLTDVNFSLKTLFFYLVIVLLIYYKLYKLNEKNKKKHTITYCLESDPGFFDIT
jgi:ComEC/Rec2-related protein